MPRQCHVIFPVITSRPTRSLIRRRTCPDMVGSWEYTE